MQFFVRALAAYLRALSLEHHDWKLSGDTSKRELGGNMGSNITLAV